MANKKKVSGGGSGTNEAQQGDAPVQKEETPIAPSSYYPVWLNRQRGGVWYHIHSMYSTSTAEQLV